MRYINLNNEFSIEIPNGFLLFISGVPGVGKTTVSYELLKRFDKFRIVEETDLIREILRGYQEYTNEIIIENIGFETDQIRISDHNKLLSFDEAKHQCRIMKKSIEKIAERQNRKGICTIINGVHIIPEILDGIMDNKNTLFVNLFINNEREVYNRIANRDPNSYMLNSTSYIFRSNIDLYNSTKKMVTKNNVIFKNIDVTNLGVNDTIIEIIKCINSACRN